jgi:AcrR family transcriptional regulator
MSQTIATDSTEVPVAKSLKGRESRNNILLAAAELATIHGLKGLSIGDLAKHLGMSKSGLYAHFKSKEELELATIQTASEIFAREVLSPAMTAKPGVTRLLALADEFLGHLKRRVFPGGCFFAAISMELAARPQGGVAQDRVAQVRGQWMGLLHQCVTDAQRLREIQPEADAEQIVFEIYAMLIAANMSFVMSKDEKRLSQGRRGVEHLLQQLAAKR